jgi:hypothetical protein
MDNNLIHSVVCKILESVGMAMGIDSISSDKYSTVLLASRIVVVDVHTKSYDNYH